MPYPFRDHDQDHLPEHDRLYVQVPPVAAPTGTEVLFDDGVYRSVASASDSGIADLIADPSSATSEQLKTTYAPVASPVLTGSPTAPTPPVGDSSGNIATTEFVDTAVAEAHTLINANINGVKADATTDDAPAWQALVNAASVGDVITFTGTSVLQSPIIWKSGVSLVGAGTARSILKTVDTTGSNYFSAIDRSAAHGGTMDAPLEDCLFADFQIDGSGISGTAYNIAAKGIFIQYAERCIFRNLYIHDTNGSGLGSDFLRNSLITGCVLINCGRQWDGSSGGAAGIGIGTGAWADEPLVISDCICIADGSTTRGQWGIFVEYQTTQPNRGRGYKVANCVVMGYHNGFGDRGTAGVDFINCLAAGNAVAGFQVVYGASGGSIVDCTARNTLGGNGIIVQSDCAGDYTIARNRVRDNVLGRGIFINGPSAALNMPHMVIEDNVCSGNDYDGIYVVGPASATAYDDLSISGNVCYSNGKADVTNAKDGITIQASVTNGRVKNNHAYDPQTIKTQGRGIRMPASASFAWTDTEVKDNNFKGNAGANVFPGSQINSGVAFRGNKGCETEGTGAATIADTTNAVTVTHGLSGTPTAVTLGKRTSEDVWVSARTATTFTVSRTGTTGALIFDWAATYAPA